jgi:hypothetical protein
MIEQKYIDRFHSRYVINSDTQCWEWTGFLNRDGYGQIKVKGHSYLAHRLSALIYGLDMSKPVVRHMCNNPKCVNYEHLQTGSVQDNIDDMVSADRHTHGERNGRAKLTQQQADEIRRKYKPRVYTLKMLADEYGVGEVPIFNVVKNKTYRR